MAKKQKIEAVSPQVVEFIRNEFDSNGVQLYQVDDIPSQLIGSGLLAQGAIDKTVSAFVALSGCADPEMDYILMGLVRKDADKQSGNLVTDIDPIMLAYDHSLGAPNTGSIQVFHGNFDDRTQTLMCEADTSLSDLRSTITTTGVCFEQADQRYANAMHFMAPRFKQAFLGGGGI